MELYCVRVGGTAQLAARYERKLGDTWTKGKAVLVSNYPRGIPSQLPELVNYSKRTEIPLNFIDG